MRSKQLRSTGKELVADAYTFELKKKVQTKLYTAKNAASEKLSSTSTTLKQASTLATHYQQKATKKHVTYLTESYTVEGRM